MIRRVASILLWWCVWVALSWPADAKEIVFGAFVALFVTVMTAEVFQAARAGEDAGRKKAPVTAIFVKIFWFMAYVCVFLWECVKANFDVAFRVLHPYIPIRPGTIRVATTLRSDIGLTFLANSMTLTPGTTSVDIDKAKGYLYIHWLCVKETDGKLGRLPVVQKYERILKRIFE